MKLVLVNSPDLTNVTIIPPNVVVSKYFSFIIPAATVKSVVIVPIVDMNMSVDNMNVVTQLSVTIVGANPGPSGEIPYGDNITLIGESVFVTENYQPLILQGQTKTGVNVSSPSSMTVISCGQTSTLVD